ncbi:MAG: hypothetical protein WD025_00385 [Bacteriovoracaceae bacterium]
MIDLISPVLLSLLGVAAFFVKNKKLNRYLDFSFALVIMVNLLIYHSAPLALSLFFMLALFNLSIENIDLKKIKTTVIKKKNRVFKWFNIFIGFALASGLAMTLSKEKIISSGVWIDKTDVYNLLIFLFLIFAHLKRGKVWKA